MTSNETFETFEQHAMRLVQPDQRALLEACEAAAQRVPENQVTGDCGTVTLTLRPLGGGKGIIQADIFSFLGNIMSLSFVGEWLKLGFPPAAGYFTNANSRLFPPKLNSPRVLLISRIAPGPGLIVANLTFLEAILPEDKTCVGLLPSDERNFT